MHILLSNDDGYQAPGLKSLVDALSTIAKITVVAPNRDRSGASNSLTLDSPIRANRTDCGFYAVDGTPTDCVHLAITGLLDEEPDMVISGINNGANMGDDVLYSGTVAAAIEGRFLGLPAMAVSLDCKYSSGATPYFSSASSVVKELIARLQRSPLARQSILNVNVPNRPFNDIKGYKVSRLGHRHKAEPVIRQLDPRGRPFYWVGPVGAEQDAGPGTDFYTLRAGYVSITPLHVDLTKHAALEDLTCWLEETE